MTEGQIVAVGLLTQDELQLLGAGFKRAWSVDESRASKVFLKQSTMPIGSFGARATPKRRRQLAA